MIAQLFNDIYEEADPDMQRGLGPLRDLGPILVYTGIVALILALPQLYYFGRFVCMKVDTVESRTGLINAVNIMIIGQILDFIVGLLIIGQLGEGVGGYLPQAIVEVVIGIAIIWWWRSSFVEFRAQKVRELEKEQQQA